MKSILTIIFTSICLYGFSWNSAGHKISALIAFEHLPTDVSDKIVTLIKAHPRFNSDFKMPIHVKKSSKETQNKWVFMQAAIWPDLARGFSGKDRKTYHRGSWHYINEAVYLTSFDKKYYADTLPSNLSRNTKSSPEHKYNVAQAYKMMLNEINDNKVDDKKMSLYLCWIFHIIGDIHQPLHSSALFNTDKFFTGDKGGNSVMIRNINKSLHSYWDGLLGNSNWSDKKLRNKTKKILSNQNLSTIVKSSTDSLNMNYWISESNKIANAIAYNSDIKKRIHEAKVVEGKVWIRMNTNFFITYDKNAKIVAERRIYEAGLRLAEILNQLVKS